MVVSDNLQKLFTTSKGGEVLPLLLQRARLCERAHARRGLEVARELGVALVVLLLAVLGLRFRFSCTRSPHVVEESGKRHIEKKAS